MKHQDVVPVAGVAAMGTLEPGRFVAFEVQMPGQVPLLRVDFGAFRAAEFAYKTNNLETRTIKPYQVCLKSSGLGTYLGTPGNQLTHLAAIAHTYID